MNNHILIEALQSARQLLANVDGLSKNNICNLASEEVEKIDRALIATSTKPAEGAAGVDEVPNFCLLIDELLMSWLKPNKESQDVADRRIKARTNLEKAIADLRAQLARQQAPVSDSVDTPEFRHLEANFVKATIELSGKDHHADNAELFAARTALITHITAWKDSQRARERHGSMRTALESFTVRMSSIDPHPEVTAAELIASIRKEAESALATPAAQAQGEPVVYGYHYEWASCITTDGPQNFKWEFSKDPPPDWSVTDGQARNIKPLFLGPSPQADEEFNGEVLGRVTTYLSQFEEFKPSGDDSADQAFLNIVECVERLRKSQADEVRDTARLDFMTEHEAWIAWGQDAERCRVFHRNDEGDSEPMMGWDVPGAWADTAREAIDSAMALKRTTAADNRNGDA